MELKQHTIGPWTDLHRAAERGSTSTVLTVLIFKESLDAYINQGNPDGKSALSLATLQGSCANVESLLLNGASVDTVDVRRRTALHFSSWNGRADLSSILIGAGADLEAVDSLGYTPLVLAATGGWCDAMGVLLVAGANVHFITPGGETALSLAASCGRIGAVKMLVQAGAVRMEFDVHGGSEKGILSLSLSSEHGHYAIMSILLDAGVVDDGLGLRSAIKAGRGRSVQLLLSRRAGDIEQYVALDEAGDEARTVPFYCFHSEALAPSSCRVMRLLLEAGADTTMNIMVNYQDGTFAMLTDLVQYADYLIGRGRVGNSKEEENLAGLKGLRRLLMQKEAVTATSWLWPTGGAGEGIASASVNSTSTPTSLAGTMPVLRRRAARRGFAVSAMLRFCV